MIIFTLTSLFTPSLSSDLYDHSIFHLFVMQKVTYKEWIVAIFTLNLLLMNPLLIDWDRSFFLQSMFVMCVCHGLFVSVCFTPGKENLGGSKTLFCLFFVCIFLLFYIKGLISVYMGCLSLRKLRRALGANAGTL